MRTPLALVALLFVAPCVMALATEQFGNTPVPKGWDTFTPDLLPVLDDTARVYWYEVNGDASFYYQGEAFALNALLKQFAAGGKGREVILHAGPLQIGNLTGSKRFTADWHVHVPGGISLSHFPEGGLVTDKGPALHLYVNQSRATLSVPAARLAEWIKELDDDRGAVRVRARFELEKQGLAASAALRKVLDTSPSPEVKRSIKALLSKLRGISLDLLVIPAGVTVVGPDDLLARLAKGIQSKDSTIRGIATGELARLELDRKKAVEQLQKVLKEEKHEYVRRCVIGALQREGKHAEPALPELRAGLRDADVNVRNACKAAVESIEKAKEEPGEEARVKAKKALQADIRAFLQERAAR